MEWFVYDDETYYPVAEIIEAETAEEAARISCDDYGQGVVVFPPDACAHSTGSDDVLGTLRDRGVETTKWRRDQLAR